MVILGGSAISYERGTPEVNWSAATRNCISAFRGGHFVIDNRTGAMALLPLWDGSCTCEDYNAYSAHPWAPFPLRRAHPGLGAQIIPEVTRSKRGKGLSAPPLTISGYLEKGIQTRMAQGRSTKIISLIKLFRTTRLSIKNPAHVPLGIQPRVG